MVPVVRKVRISLVLFVAMMLAALAGLPPNQAAAAADVVVAYQPPVSGQVVDGWRAPNGPYGAGNRGVDYAVSVGESVGATADGVVTFAGSVAGKRWVVIRHADSRRSSLGPLASIAVSVGDSVTIGQSIGTAVDVAVHWGVREAGTYIDPTTLLNGPKGKLRLTR